MDVYSVYYEVIILFPTNRISTVINSEASLLSEHSNATRGANYVHLLSVSILLSA